MQRHANALRTVLKASLSNHQRILCSPQDCLYFSCNQIGAVKLCLHLLHLKEHLVIFMDYLGCSFIRRWFTTMLFRFFITIAPPKLNKSNTRARPYINLFFIFYSSSFMPEGICAGIYAEVCRHLSERIKFRVFRLLKFCRAQSL